VLFDCFASAREGLLVDFLADVLAGVSHPDASRIFAGRHFAAESSDVRDELGVDAGGLQILYLLADVAGHAELGVLVNGLRDQAGHVSAPAEDVGKRVAETGCGLDGREADLPDVIRVVHAENATHLVERSLLGHFQTIRL